MEQPDVFEGPSGVPIVSALRLTLSQEARASLEAVRVAQETARRRARQQTMRTRVWFLTVVGGAALVAGFGPRLARAWQGQRPAPVQEAATVPAPVRPVAMLAPPPAATRPAATAMPATTPAVKERPNAAAATGCDAAALGNAPWRLSPEACAQAFEADPNNSSLALAVAQAEHARGHLAEAGRWANRALALDPNAAEAYVIVARAEADKGRQPEARLAYRHYLELAPRGWHRTEARSALRHGDGAAR